MRIIDLTSLLTMNETWPHLNRIPDPQFPTPFVQTTSAHVDSVAEHVIDVVRSTYQVEARDCEVEIWYAGSMLGLTPLLHIPQQALKIVQAEPCLPFYSVDTDLVLSSEPEHDGEIEPVTCGYHTHSLIFTHPLTLELVRELRTVEVLSYDEPCVFYITLTYKCGDTPVFRSRFLANYVRSDDLQHGAGPLTKTTVFQCFLAEMLLPVEKSRAKPDPVQEFEELMLQAALYQEAIEDDLSENFDFEDDKDESGDEDEDE